MKDKAASETTRKIQLLGRSTSDTRKAEGMPQTNAKAGKKARTVKSKVERTNAIRGIPALLSHGCMRMRAD